MDPKHPISTRNLSAKLTIVPSVAILVLLTTTSHMIILAHTLPLIEESIGNCQVDHYDENLQSILPYTGANLTSVGLGLVCQNINSNQLQEQFNRLHSSSQDLRVISLIVRDSNLSSLSNLPQGTHELKKLILSNTSIDLEVLKEGSESLVQLTTLEITNEKISNVPQNFFQQMQSLKELRLDNDGIASLDSDAFNNLDDSLEILGLRNNRFNRFPMAVKNLAQLTILDLSNNDIVIDTQESDLPEKLEQLLNLRELNMNRINCTCEFSSTPFYEWIVRLHIYGVRCSSPEKLRAQEVIVFERDEFCARSSGATLTLNLNWFIIVVNMLWSLRLFK